jgi:outer membrane immunogenic protein
MAVKAPPPPASAFTWTGWYVGANAGYSWGNPSSDTTLTGFVTTGVVTAAHSEALKFSGAVGGVQVGYNYQAWNRWVAGLEADWQATSENASLHYLDPYSGAGPFCPIVCVPFFGAATTDYEASILWFGTVRGRLGYAWDRILIYTTGGFAYGDVRLRGSVNDSGVFLTPYNGTSTFSLSQARTGWTLGGGIEGALTNNWSWKAEYLYIDLGAMNTTIAGPFTGETVTLHSNFTDNIVRVG